MSTHVHTGLFVSKTASTTRSPRQIADRALKTAAAFWFAVVVAGELLMTFTIASFYGLTATRGNWQQWNKTMTHGYITGQPIGNVVVAIHLASAVIILLSGAIQLLPQVLRWAPRFHRVNGRIYMVTAFTVSLAGLYMLWFRGSVGSVTQHIGQSVDAVLIMLCAVLALRYALARNLRTHRRWALRLFIAVSASLFIRAGFFISFALNHGPFGFDDATLTGPFLTFMSFAQYLVPLAVLEMYFYTQDRAGAAGRFAMATGLVVLTLMLGAGVGMVALSSFLPNIKRAYDSRIPISDTLSTTLSTGGIDRAIIQYHQVKASVPGKYNLDEDELNLLGYQLLRTHQYQQAIRIFQLNTEEYPRSGNTWDSLAEAYMDDGNKPQAIAYYRKALQLSPGSRSALTMLKKLNAQ